MEFALTCLSVLVLIISAIYFKCLLASARIHGKYSVYVYTPTKYVYACRNGLIDVLKRM